MEPFEPSRSSKARQADVAEHLEGVENTHVEEQEHALSEDHAEDIRAMQAIQVAVYQVSPHDFSVIILSSQTQERRKNRMKGGNQ